MKTNAIVILDAKIERVLKPKPPFSFDGTVFTPSHFPMNNIYYEKGVYCQTLYFLGQFYGLKFVNSGTVNNPSISLFVFYNSQYEELVNIDALIKEIEYRIELQRDLMDFTEKFIDDSILGPAIKRWCGMRIGSTYSLYEFTVVTTVLQNTVVRRSKQMMENLFQTYGKLLSFDEKQLYAFWHPSAMVKASEEELRNLKLGYRAKILKNQALVFTTGKVDEEKWRTLDKDTLKKKLLAVYGIGPATVQYMLFEIFHHYDAFEHVPPWEQKIYSKLLFDQELVDTSTILNTMDERYGKWKMLAAHYIFENLFWLRRNENIPWLETLIRL